MSMTPLQELRHSAAHVLATAVMRHYPDAKLDIGPPTDTGFYYDFDLGHRFTPEDLAELEAEMGRVAAEDQPFERVEVGREEARALFERVGQPYKIGRLDDIPEGEPVTLYRNGEFTDLCAGTHVVSTGRIGAFKLLNVAGAYHRGDERNAQLQRIYGTAFPTAEELERHLRRLEEARERDHRKIGRELDLFLIDEAVGQGLVLWKPAGAIIRQELQEFILGELNRQGYEQVFTPHIGRLGLYRTSGHFPYYRDSQYPPIVEREALDRLAGEGCSCAELCNRLEAGGVEGYLLKPMNCPMHIRIFASAPRSYRDLPVRLAEFGTVYRWEQSGELNGMTRVRGFTQDDAHIFCTEDQLGAEIAGCLELVKIVLGALGLAEYRVRIGMRDADSAKYTGDPVHWVRAEEALRVAARALGVPFTEEPGEAAFYGPKIDFVVRDVLDREWQLGTVQVDYNLPERFDLKYVGADNQPHRPVMVHRAPFGSLERFCGVLIEHFGGAFPAWLAPEQARVLPIAEAQFPYADSVLGRLRDAGVRAGADRSADKIGAKIRRAQLAKVPYMLVVGGREAAAGKAALRVRGAGDLGALSLDEVVARVCDRVRTRSLEL